MSEVKNESRNPSLDGVRAIACISVFCVHFMQVLQLDDRTGLTSVRRLLEYGFGVSAFIIISGALIDRDRSDSERSVVGLVDYLGKKLLRIFPMYYTTVFCIVLVSFLYSSGIGRLDILSHALFVHNLSDRFLYSISPPFWYLGVQMQAYFVVSLIAMFLPIGKSGVKVRSLLLIFIAFVCWLVFGFLVLHIPENSQGLLRWFTTNPMAVRHSVVAHLPNFLLAMAFSQQVLNGDVLKLKHRFGNDILIVLLLVSMTWIGLSVEEKHITYWNGRYCFPFLTISSIYLISLCSSGFLVSSILRCKAIAWLGSISFPFYLVHYSILGVTCYLFKRSDISLNGWAKNALCFLLAFGTSMVLAFLLKYLNDITNKVFRNWFSQLKRIHRNLK
jgi:peptidoglycan/LPS O-acetylase OafA/YrhL